MKCDNLVVWKNSLELSCEFYKYFNDFKKSYGFKDQITRCCLSIPSNIAEGMERSTNKDKANFLTISNGSSAEFITQTHIGIKVGFIDGIVGEDWLLRCEQNMKSISALKVSL